MNIILPIELFKDDNISSAAKILYANLMGMAEEINFIQMGLVGISEKLGIAPRTVIRNTNELISLGLLVRYRDNFRDINNYIIIPYDIKESGIEIENKEQFDLLLLKIKDYIDVSIKGKKKSRASAKTSIEIIQNIDEKLSSNNKLNLYDYGAYFFKLNFEKNGYVTKFKGAKYLAILKRLSDGRSEEDVLRIIRVFISIYDDKFKKDGFETPIIEYLGTTWILNKVIQYAKNIPYVGRELIGNMELSKEVF